MFNNQDLPNFTISGGGADFTNRQKSLFDKLNEVEKLAGGSQQEDIPMELHSTQVEEMSIDFDATRRLKRKRRSETKHLRGQESIFKRPEVPPPWRAKGIPDHKKNPHKWTRYDLGDVSQDDMSDHTNTSTALSFLGELRKRKMSPESLVDEPQNVMFSKGGILFKKPTSSRHLNVEVIQPLDRLETHGPVFRGSKRVMPEYIVGQGLKKNKKKPAAGDGQKTLCTSKELKLNHLLEDEEEFGE